VIDTHNRILQVLPEPFQRFVSFRDKGKTAAMLALEKETLTARTDEKASTQRRKGAEKARRPGNSQ
jgi:hypothetical protein